MKGADEPDDDLDTRRETDHVEPAEIVDHAESPSSGVTLPPWLVDEESADDEEPVSEALLRATAELSPDFFDSADELPDTVQSELSYDEWLQIQQEANREHTIDEEVPDLLAEDSETAAPFLEESPAVPAATGELPNWFLGLEELDESQAPDWFLAQGAEDEPAVDETPPDSEAWELPPDLDDVAAMMPDLFGGSVADAPAANDATDTFLDDFSWQQQETSAEDVSEQSSQVDEIYVSDWEPAAEPYVQALPDDDFYAAYASLGEDPTEASDSGIESALPDQLQDFSEPVAPAELTGVSAPEDTFWPDSELPAEMAREAEFDEPDLSAFADTHAETNSAGEAVPVVEDSPQTSLDDESLSWLSEISSMVKSVTSHSEDSSGASKADSDEPEDHDEAGQDYFFADEA
ncbi:MAG: hypothetical protein KC519_15365, partial [Anaerolineae bacterium]|nr:hypothetical protein [Anaerolineae bacterium]